MKKNVDGLEIPKASYSINPLELKVQQFGFFILFTLLTLGIFGLLGGSSILSKSTSASPNKQISITHVFVLRSESSSKFTLHINISSDILKNNQLILQSINTNKYTVKQISPAPIKTELTPNGITYYFDIDPKLNKADVHFIIEPTGPGILSNDFSLINNEEVTYTQVILP